MSFVRLLLVAVILLFVLCVNHVESRQKRRHFRRSDKDGRLRQHALRQLEDYENHDYQLAKSGDDDELWAGFKNHLKKVSGSVSKAALNTGDKDHGRGRHAHRHLDFENHDLVHDIVLRSGVKNLKKVGGSVGKAALNTGDKDRRRGRRHAHRHLEDYENHDHDNAKAKAQGGDGDDELWAGFKNHLKKVSGSVSKAALNTGDDHELDEEEAEHGDDDDDDDGDNDNEEGWVRRVLRKVKSTALPGPISGAASDKDHRRGRRHAHRHLEDYENHDHGHEGHNNDHDEGWSSHFKKVGTAIRKAANGISGDKDHRRVRRHDHRHFGRAAEDKEI